jgi:hypothetical protein
MQVSVATLRAILGALDSVAAGISRSNRSDTLNSRKLSFSEAKKISGLGSLLLLLATRQPGNGSARVVERNTSRRGEFMRKFLLLVCVLGTATALWGQAGRGSWESLSTLRAGQKIQVVDAKFKKHSGTLVSVSATAISLRGAGGEQSVVKEDVRSVKVPGRHRLRNTLIGGAVGAGAGAGVLAAAWEDKGFVSGKGTGAAVGAGIGGVVGLVIGALSPSTSTIYSVKAH